MEHSLAFVPIVMAHPILGIVMTRLVAPNGRQIKELVGAVHHINATGIGRIGMEDGLLLVLIEHANALTVRHPRIA